MIAVLLAAALTIPALGLVGVATATSAGADVPPVADSGTGHVTADALPTVQINGVVWDQTVIGNTVYAVGEFTKARPAGSALGTNETAKSNILAYDITTGQLRSTFTASLNAKGKAITASPDGSRLYVGGAFTSVNGVSRYRIVALDPTTGAVITGFNAIVDYNVNALVATSTTVYAGGAFRYAGSGLTNPRNRLAAFSASNGAVLPWAPSPDADVNAIVMGPDGTRVFVGGSFKTINGSTARGVAPVNATTGAVIAWPANTVVKIGGASAAILSLKTDGTNIFSSSYTYGRADGNLESSFAANAATGAITWIEDCHGDSYDGLPMNGYFYVVSHSHYCGNVGGFWQTENWGTNQRHALSFTLQATGTLRREPWAYFNWEGRPAPSIVNWFPEWQPGTYTGQTQAAWTIEGNSKYVVMGGEFLRVNNTAQQGLVRFAVKGTVTPKSAPHLSGSTFPINVKSSAPAQVKISFPANWDRDSLSLSYRIVRDGNTAAPIYSTTVKSTFWDQPTIGFVDKGVAAGSTHTYRVYANDADGNQATSDPVSVTVAGTGQASPYAEAVLADGPRIQWRLGEGSGSVAADSAALDPGTRDSGATFGAAGALLNESNKAVSLTNSSTSRIYDPKQSSSSQQVFSVEAWVKTASTTGGRIVGFGDKTSTTSTNTDRLLYLTSAGKVTFGVNQHVAGLGPALGSSKLTVASSAAINNNQWHHVVGTVGPTGMFLYVDGKLVASRADAQGGAAYYGYWKVGTDTLSGWPSRPTTDSLTGTVDEVAVYASVLTPAQVAKHWTASGR